PSSLISAMVCLRGAVRRCRPSSRLPHLLRLALGADIPEGEGDLSRVASLQRRAGGSRRAGPGRARAVSAMRQTKFAAHALTAQAKPSDLPHTGLGTSAGADAMPAL